MDKGLGVKIIRLRNLKYNYNQISKELNCSKALVSYHCRKNNINDIGLANSNLTFDEIELIKLYYLTHTIKETSANFNISKSTVKYHVSSKRILLTVDEKKEHNYESVRSYRQRNKIKAIDYKGGKCEICGYDKSNWSLEFHHTDPNNKDFNISSKSHFNWDKIKIELDKCILVCKNCHGEIHELEYNRRVCQRSDGEADNFEVTGSNPVSPTLALVLAPIVRS